MAAPLAELFGDLAAVFGRLAARWYVFGAQAAIVYGSVRLTADADVTAFLEEEKLADALAELSKAGFAARISDPLDFARSNRVLPLLHNASGIPVDVVLGGSGLEEQFAGRAVQVDIGGVSVPMASCEDVVAMKILAGRSKDLDDAEAILAAQAGRMSLDLSRTVLKELEQALDRRDLVKLFDDLLRRI